MVWPIYKLSTRGLKTDTLPTWGNSRLLPLPTSLTSRKKKYIYKIITKQNKNIETSPLSVPHAVSHQNTPPTSSFAPHWIAPEKERRNRAPIPNRDSIKNITHPLILIKVIEKALNVTSNRSNWAPIKLLLFYDIVNIPIINLSWCHSKSSPLSHTRKFVVRPKRLVSPKESLILIEIFFFFFFFF